MRRVVFGGSGFATLLARNVPFTDRYVKLVFLDPGASYPEPLDLEVVRATMAPETWPILRTYTIRWIDETAAELAIDFVVHGEEGLAGPWAASAQPGDEIHLRGPGGAYTPDPAADHHLFVGDEAAIPAIAAGIEALEPGAQATAFIEVTGPDDEQPLPSKADVAVHWLHRGAADAGSTELLDQAVRAWQWPEGRVCAFVHGESKLLRTVRPYLANDRQVARGDLSVSAYWRVGATEEGFRQWKAEQVS
ncbi:MAG: hypothetical protein JWP10_280 [Nocardioidaceae bacterium]|nr:hypothetical protein [Nocardioidaceae bacterium]